MKKLAAIDAKMIATEAAREAEPLHPSLSQHSTRLVTPPALAFVSEQADAQVRETAELPPLVVFVF